MNVGDVSGGEDAGMTGGGTMVDRDASLFVSFDEMSDQFAIWNEAQFDKHAVYFEITQLPLLVL